MGSVERWRRRSKGCREKQEWTPGLLPVFIASPTPVVGNKALPRGPLVLLSSYLHNHTVVSNGGGGGAKGSDVRKVAQGLR